MRTTVKVVLYTGKTLKDGKHPIMLRLTKNRQQIKLGLGLKCALNEWDPKTNLPKRKHPLYLEYRTQIEKVEKEAEKIILKFENEDIDYTLENIKLSLLKKHTNHTVFSYIEEWVERLKAMRRVGYADTFHATKKSLMGYQGDKDFPFSQVNYNFLAKWEEYHMRKGTKPNTFFIYARTLKTIINSARREGVVPQEYNPYKDYSFTKFRRIQTERRAITKEQLQKLKEVKLEEDSALLTAQHLFFFSFYCRGINFIDMAHLKWSCIRNNRLYYTRKKTKESFNIGLLTPANEILNYYRPLTSHLPGQYIFPILTDFHKNERQQKDRVKKVLTQVNKSLKELAKLAEVDVDLTTYVARHSFATVLKQSGVPISQISEMMGHDSEATTRIYLKGFGDEVLDEAAKALL